MFENFKKTTFDFKTKQFKVNYDTLGYIANANPTGTVKTSFGVLNCVMTDHYNDELLC